MRLWTWRALVAVRDARGDPVGSNAAARRAYELNPGSPEAIRLYVGILYQEGRFDEALALNERVVALDPLSPTYLTNLAGQYAWRLSVLASQRITSAATGATSSESSDRPSWVFQPAAVWEKPDARVLPAGSRLGTSRLVSAAPAGRAGVRSTATRAV